MNGGFTQTVLLFMLSRTISNMLFVFFVGIKALYLPFLVFSIPFCSVCCSLVFVSSLSSCSQ